MLLESLEPGAARALLKDWRFWARGEQLAPPGDWRIWLFLGGRGAGKTRAGAEWVLEGVREHRFRRIALIGATYADVRDVMIGGDSGLAQLSGVWFEPSKRRLTWPEGATAMMFSAEEPDGLRGHQFDAAWCDEQAAGLIGELRASELAKARCTLAWTKFYGDLRASYDGRPNSNKK